MNGARTLAATVRAAAIALAIAAAFVYGWRVTRIDLYELVTKAHLIRPLLHDLVRPDVAVETPRQQRAGVAITLEPPAPPAALAPTGPSLSASTTVARIGDAVTVRGERFAPGRPGVLRWVDQAEASAELGRVRTGPGGGFGATVRIPDSLGVRGRIEAVVDLAETEWRFSETLRLVSERMLETIFLALMGTTMGVLFAVPLSFLGAKNLARGTIGGAAYVVTRTVFNLMRSIEPLILATVFAVWVGIGPFAGVLALAVHSIASLGKLYSEQIEAIDAGPIEAISATGATQLQIVRYAVVPQIVPQFIAFTIYRWDINVRMSTVIGFVGGGGIGFLLQQYINLLQWRQVATAVWAITIVVAAMDYFSAKVREKVV